MKVFIGPYINIDVDGADAERQVEVEVHDYDTWSLNHTLAKIIYPALIRFREITNSYPMVDDEDVPDMEPQGARMVADLHGITKNSYEYDRWINVLDQMIFSFHCLYMDNSWEDDYYQRGTSHEEIAVVEERINNGFRLFGKYYGTLWN